ncbi:hypothetical protein T4B_5942 [Trichinella pseudospiralis]|uniref:Uncharacterized protein n=1 Tax=Trichinella pseudospiralis TaxID=6337 RepID=A0A0V1HNV9_TRIPS|nr:hypothetical protein T4B_5942 [Trichinella pseudospiralis]
MVNVNAEMLIVYRKRLLLKHPRTLEMMQRIQSHSYVQIIFHPDHITLFSSLVKFELKPQTETYNLEQITVK